MLRKCIVKELISSAQYLVEDVITNELVTMTVSGKQRMNYFNLQGGDEIYVICSPYKLERGRLCTTTDFKMDDSGALFNEKIKLDQKYRKMMKDKECR